MVVCRKQVLASKEHKDCSKERKNNHEKHEKFNKEKVKKGNLVLAMFSLFLLFPCLKQHFFVFF